MSQYVSAPGDRIHWYAEFVVSSPVMAKTNVVLILRRDGQAEWQMQNNPIGIRLSRSRQRRGRALISRFLANEQVASILQPITGCSAQSRGR